MPTLAELNQMKDAEARAELMKCCGSRVWVEGMLKARPFGDAPALFTAAERVWGTLSHGDWLEAFSHHPRIGEKSAGWAGEEQRGVQSAPAQVASALARGNSDYEKRFGHVFLVCASGKTADEMLGILNERIHNDPAFELELAAREQAKITRIRLEKWLNS